MGVLPGGGARVRVRRGGARVTDEVRERAPAADEHAVWLEPREVRIDLVLAGLLNPHGRDADLRTARPRARHGPLESDRLHPVALDLACAGVEHRVELLVVAAA